MSRLGIFGTSGFAREVADIAYELDYAPFFIARDEGELNAWGGRDQIILEREVYNIADAKFVIGIGENALREKVAKRYFDTIEFVNLVHPSSSFGRAQREQLERCQGVIVGAGVRLTNNIEVGDFTVLNLNVTVGHDVLVDNFVNIAPGAHISGNVHIKERCWIGTGAVINQGSSCKKLVIGEGTIIGSGAVVLNDCDENSVYVGAPAKRIK